MNLEKFDELRRSLSDLNYQIRNEFIDFAKSCRKKKHIGGFTHCGSANALCFVTEHDLAVTNISIINDRYFAEKNYLSFFSYRTGKRVHSVEEYPILSAKVEYLNDSRTAIAKGKNSYYFYEPVYYVKNYFGNFLLDFQMTYLEGLLRSGEIELKQAFPDVEFEEVEYQKSA